MPRSKQTRIANLVMNCVYCQPTSGCILSDLKDKPKKEILTNLNVLTEDGLDRIISFHACCPFRHKLAIDL